MGGSTTGSTIIVEWPNVPGQYSYEGTVVSNTDGCTAVCTGEIIVTDEVIANAGPNATICQGGNVTLDGTGSSQFGSLLWTPISGDFFSIDFGGSSTSPQVSPLVTTEYELVVTDPINGCVTVDRVVVFVDVELNPTAIASAPTPVCVGEPFQLMGSNSLPPVGNPGAVVSYFWVDANNAIVNNAPIEADPTITLNSLGAATYTLIVADANCSDTTQVTIIPEGCSNLGDFVFEDLNENGCQDGAAEVRRYITYAYRYKNRWICCCESVSDYFRWYYGRRWRWIYRSSWIL